jgi:NADP-dependent 3-hydroxy acid dehydrogenase YdfG
MKRRSAPRVGQKSSGRQTKGFGTGVSPLHGRYALVTGASQGIGQAIAVALARAGATVGLVGRSRATLNKTARAIGRTPPTHVVEADLTRDDNIRLIERFVRNEWPRVDILVHSAGVYARGTLAASAIDRFDELYRANVRAPYLLTQALLPLLVAARGEIVFINSSQGLNASAGVGQYAATHHARRAIADSLRHEVNADGVRVLSVYPGRTATPLMREICELEGIPYRPERLMQPSDIADGVIAALALPRTAELTDLSIRPRQKS